MLRQLPAMARGSLLPILLLPQSDLTKNQPSVFSPLSITFCAILRLHLAETISFAPGFTDCLLYVVSWGKWYVYSSYFTVVWLTDNAIQPPRSKAVPAEVKQKLIHDHIRSTCTCHTLKDLEKMLPSVASINGMQVKDFITGLLNENKIRMEKIGSNNWYWSFPSDEKRERENVQERLLRESNCLAKSVEQFENELQKKQVAAKEEEDTRDPMDIETERQTLLERKAELSTEIERLKTQKAAFEDNGVSKIKQRTEEINKWKLKTEMWEDNISIMEQYLYKLAGGDRGLVEAIKKQCYGDDYQGDHDISEAQC